MDLIWPQSTNLGIFYMLFTLFLVTNFSFGLNFTYKIFRKVKMHMVSFENFVKSMTPSLLESKVTPSFCFPFKIPDDPTTISSWVISKMST